MRDEKKYRPLRKQARELIVKEGLTQKEVADRLGLAAKTVSTWYNKNGWADARMEAVARTGGADSLYDFMSWLRDYSPADFAAVELLYKSYLNNH